MATLPSGLCGCYRCSYVWRPAHSRSPRICPRCKSRLWDFPKLHSVRSGHGAGIPEVLSPQRDAVIRAAEHRGFDHVRVFGSVRRGQATARSDVDLLVHRRRGTSMLDQAGLELDLEGILGRKVDVVIDEALHWLVRPQVLFEAVPL